MKRLLLVLLSLTACSAMLVAQTSYPEVSISQIQQVPAESLLVADSLQNTVSTRWTLQTSPYVGDTVTITGICVVPGYVLNWNVGGYTMLLYDTAQTEKWGGILVMAGKAADTTELSADGFMNVVAGDTIKMTGLVAEYPTSSMNSGTEFLPIPGQPIEIINNGPVPSAATSLSAGEIYKGLFNTGKVQYSTGEPYEGRMVEFHKMTINSKFYSSSGRYIFSAIDSAGNEITTYDASKYWTTSSTRQADSVYLKWYAGVSVGTVLDTLRGFLVPASGQNNNRGYFIAPVYHGDVVVGALPAPPVLSAHRRYPVVVTPDTTATVSVKATRQTNGSTPKTITLMYSVNDGSFVADTMTYQASDTTYVGVIPQQSENTVVRYFVELVDSLSQIVRLANSATTGIYADTSKGFFFYTVLNRGLTIHDVQYTPYINGRSPYLGAVTSLSGIITADTLHISLSANTTAWYMQSSNSPWNGIWLTPYDTTAQKELADLRNGDSVIVTGTVQEDYDVTKLGNVTSVVKVSSGNPEPDAVPTTCSLLNVSNGTASAEKYEGMLVKLSNVTVSNLNPTYSDNTEYSVSDSTGTMLVQQSEKYSYSNLEADTIYGKSIFKVGNTIGSLTGILYYSYNYYKLVPRTDADFQGVVLTGISAQQSGTTPVHYALSQNYPNPFNPSTMIQFSLPTAGQTMLKVYNILGQEVATLVNDYRNVGTYTVRFDASTLASGMYFYRVQSGSFSAVKKMMLVK